MPREKVIALNPKHRSKNKTTIINLRAAIAVPDDMPPRTYIAKCLGAKVEHRGYEPSLRLTFEIGDGPYKGVIQYGWLPLREDGVVSPTSRYYQAATVALGHKPASGEDMNPGRIFLGKWFEVRIGFSSRNRNKEYDNAYTQEKKDDRDFLRVHEILARLDR